MARDRKTEIYASAQEDPQSFQVEPGIRYEEEEPDECGDEDEIALRSTVIRAIEMDRRFRHSRQLRF